MAASLERHRISLRGPRMVGQRRTSAPWWAAVLAALLTSVAVPAQATAEPVDFRGFVRFFSGAGEDPVPPFPRHLGLEFMAREFVPPLDDISRRYFQVVVLASEAEGVIDIVRATPPEPLEVGALLNLSARVMWRGGPLEDTPFICCPLAISSGTFVLDAGDAVLEASLLEDWLVGTAPFVMNGVINAFDGTTGAPLFQQHVRGRGVARISLNTSLEEIHYFYDVVPIPEPATFTLLGLGLGGLLARRGSLHWRRRSS